MSRAATDWAWNLELSSAPKLLMLSLADRADEMHCCYPSIQRLVKDTGMDRKTIGKWINQMMEDGLISDTGERKGRTKQIRVLQLNIGIEQAQKRNSPKNGTCTKNGHETIPNLDAKRSQKRDTESVIEPVNEPLNTQAAKAACAIGVNDHHIAGRYAFEGNVIRLNHKDYRSWMNLYPLIDLNYELQRLDIEFTHEKPKNWFITASQKLSYQNKQAAARTIPVTKPKLDLNNTDWIYGVEL
ncbi:helix-turn-helix domain-containing protein [Salmonella enterica]|nr:helix-turn-helix domain-containing protein [Salmonella enterica]EJA4992437.1 helix-turn-helix domain-containing protein [Salmonella enterica]EJA5049263.1 helix-turn-helix domain-containing protein [Salmonella enterica]EJA5115405.1 helix-turn-helix domain-containing protein [Salmonella enterica]EJA5478433.1 helix-turn-helix domain-containing protein [Salmonella enterica]